jgi:hypothetical protein
MNNIKEIYNNLKYDKYCHTTHIANGVFVDFFYIEFVNKLSYIEMLIILLKEKKIFYKKTFKQAFDSSYFVNPLVEHKTTECDFIELKSMLNDVLNHLEIYTTTNNVQEKRDLNLTAGYYLNNKWLSNSFPLVLKNKILYADKYWTLMNEYSEIMIIMEKDNKYSLFYSFNDQ